MISKDYTITSMEGIHARPATKLVRLAKEYRSNISLKKGDRLVKLNSMLNILTMGAREGDTITIIVEGDDELAAYAAIDQFLTEELKNH
ncbi:MAG TPA: HPr family phosphocarrier protein [Chryseolinea sp.]|nr:HPr family phosphocarrier protein [Chryseolinea sp.]